MVALACPSAFGEDALLFAIAYGIVRGMQVALLVVAGRDDPGLRHSATGLLVIAPRSASGCSRRPRSPTGRCRARCGRSRSLLDVGGPLVIDSSGWRLMPEHFAERHGLIVIIALGESIVAIGVGAEVVGASPPA